MDLRSSHATKSALFACHYLNHPRNNSASLPPRHCLLRGIVGQFATSANNSSKFREWEWVSDEAEGVCQFEEVLTSSRSTQIQWPTNQKRLTHRQPFLVFNNCIRFQCLWFKRNERAPYAFPYDAWKIQQQPYPLTSASTCQAQAPLQQQQCQIQMHLSSS